MPQFRLGNKISPEDKTFTLVGPDAAHALRVLRYKIGDKILCLDPAGTKIEGRIEQVARDSILGSILKRWPFKTPGLKMNLYSALLKNQAWEEVLEKGTEIGVNQFIPVLTAYSAVALKKEDYPRKLSRWEKIIAGAVKQSERTIAPSISAPKTLQEILKEIPNAHASLFAWEEARENRKNAFLISEIFKAINPNETFLVNIWIGPEGGFSDEEAQLLLKKDVRPISLGENILRAETAALVSCALIQYEYQNALSKNAFSQRHDIS